MKIVDFVKPKGITFKDLQPGDCFTYYDSFMIMMKTTEDGVNNCVNLSNGHLCTHKDSIPVIPLPNAYVTFPEETKSFVKKEEKEWYDYTFKEIKLNHCKQLAGCYDCPISDACEKEHLLIEEVMDALGDILDE